MWMISYGVRKLHAVSLGIKRSAIERDLLAAEERDAWIQAQLGDYLTNGGYGSILTAFYPGFLDYVQEEAQRCELQAKLGGDIVFLHTMRKYSPLDSLSDGLMLQFGMND